jgi:hypothetical protein
MYFVSKKSSSPCRAKIGDMANDLARCGVGNGNTVATSIDPTAPNGAASRNKAGFRSAKFIMVR